MRKTLYSVLIVAVALGLAACSGGGSGVKYSPGEIQGLSPDVQQSVLSGEVFVGMAQGAVRYAWGAPSNVKALGRDSEGRYTEEWFYKSYPYSARLVFVDGTLTGVNFTKGFRRSPGKGLPQGGPEQNGGKDIQQERIKE